MPHLGEAYNLARWLTHDPKEAEDVVQDACVRGLRYFATFRGDNAKAWLLRIVRNTALARLKSRKAAAEVALEIPDHDGSDDHVALDVADPALDPEAHLAHIQTIAGVRAVVAALPTDLRECLILREMEELSYKEIAEITNVSPGTVMSRLYRARRAFAKIWVEISNRP